MSDYIYVPNSPRAAAFHVRLALAGPVGTLSERDFIRAWCSVAYLFPSLHPDGFDEPTSGWPRALRRFAVEAWRRFNAGELSERQLYPSDAQWSGLHDRMTIRTPAETRRRRQLAAEFGESIVVAEN